MEFQPALFTIKVVSTFGFVFWFLIPFFADVLAVLPLLKAEGRVRVGVALAITNVLSFPVLAGAYLWWPDEYAYPVIVLFESLRALVLCAALTFALKKRFGWKEALKQAVRLSGLRLAGWLFFAAIATLVARYVRGW